MTFKDWGERKEPEEQYGAIKAHINRELAKLPEAIAFAFPPPAIPGVGTAGGVTFMLEDRSGARHRVPGREHASASWTQARKRPEIAIGHDAPSRRRAAALRRRWTATRC